MAFHCTGGKVQCFSNLLCGYPFFPAHEKDLFALFRQLCNDFGCDCLNIFGKYGVQGAALIKEVLSFYLIQPEVRDVNKIIPYCIFTLVIDTSVMNTPEKVSFGGKMYIQFVAVFPEVDKKFLYQITCDLFI